MSTVNGLYVPEIPYTPGCRGTHPRNVGDPGMWSCTFHIEMEGHTFHFASAHDTYCAAWTDDKIFVDFVALNGERRDVHSWERVEEYILAHPEIAPVSEEEVEAAAQAAAALLAEIESKVQK